MMQKQIPMISREEFLHLAEQNPNLLQDSPWVVSGYIEHWPAYRQWQDLDYLRTRFGELRAFAKAPNFTTNNKSSLVSVETTFNQYIDYIRNPEQVERIYDGCWLEGSYRDFLAQDLPLYCGTLRIVHRADDPVFDEVGPLVPAPISTWNHALPYYYSLFNHFWLLVSLPGALTPLHRDNNGTIALVAQLKGRKRAILYSPADLPHIHNPDVGYLDPLAPDAGDFPTWDQAVQWTEDIAPGQVLFIGTNWAHHVRTLEDSISVSFDFVEHSNLAAYAVSAGWAEVFGQRIKRSAAMFAEKLGGAIDIHEIERSTNVDIGRRVMAHILHTSLRDSDDPLSGIRRRYLDHLSACLPTRDGIAA